MTPSKRTSSPSKALPKWFLNSLTTASTPFSSSAVSTPPKTSPTDDQVKSYIRRITTQLTRWMLAGKIKKLVVVVTSKDTGEDVERWQFDVAHTKPPKLATTTPTASTSQGAQEKEKGEAEVQAEIQSLFRQITACVTFLPMLDGRCTFNVLVYADGDAEVPMEWGDSEAREINGGEKVVLRSWGTSSHRVETAVSYRVAE
ncbi:DNA-binding protein [Terfezia claveryi]|nr:DNA-binding protein [Terfezia claveryi]KAF8454251.1 DNA-binding protein [Terfezia claveryi]